MMNYKSALRAYTFKRVEEIERADILVGIPCYCNQHTIEHVIRMVSHGLAKYYKDKRCVIFVADGGSTDDTREAAKEYQDVIKRNPDYLEAYVNLSMLLSSIPGRRKEAVKHIDFLIASKEVYIERWIRSGMPMRYVFWMADALREYRTLLDRKADMLAKLSRDGDVWAYFSLVRY